jgi:hypothetical protein
MIQLGEKGVVEDFQERKGTCAFGQIGLQIVILLHNGHLLLLWVECVP